MHFRSARESKADGRSPKLSAMAITRDLVEGLFEQLPPQLHDEMKEGYTKLGLAIVYCRGRQRGKFKLRKN
jgi:hypothetical protein